MACCLLAACASGEPKKTEATMNAVDISANTTGVYDGFNYELWRQSSGNVDMKLTGGGTFGCSWENSDNILFRMGKKLDSTKLYGELGNIKLEYQADYEPVGNSYLCIYGWTVDPLIEFYIVESWGTWRPPGSLPKGTFEIDGSTYNVYETTRVQKPSIQGTQTFQQFWSVSTVKRTGGTVSISDHFKTWEKLGMDLSKMYEITLCVEGVSSSGKAVIGKNILTLGSTIIGNK